MVLGGDYNVIPEPIDCHDPKAWLGDALFQPESRRAFRALLHLGFTEAFRALHPDERGAYSFWDYQGGAFQLDHGIRIDHLLLSPQAADRLAGCTIDKDPRRQPKASDHTPVIVELQGSEAHGHAMKCLLVADLHYDLRKFDWVVAAAAHVDVVVLAGDHLDAAAAVGRPSQAVIVQKYFRRIRERAPLLICSGNHDLDHRDSKGVMSTQWIARARHYDVPTDGDSRLIGDTLFTICPWADGQGPRAEIARLLERDAAAAAGPLGLAPSRPARRPRPPAGTAANASATRSCGAGSSGCSPTSCSPATCTSRPSPGTAPGPTGSATPGCSTPATRSAPCPRTSWSIPSGPAPTGARWPRPRSTPLTAAAGRPYRAGGRSAGLAPGYGSTGSSDAGMKPVPCSWASDSSTSSTMPR